MRSEEAPAVQSLTLQAAGAFVGALAIAGLLLSGGLPAPGAIAAAVVAAALAIGPNRAMRLVSDSLFTLAGLLFILASLNFAAPGPFVLIGAASVVLSASAAWREVTSPTATRGDRLLLASIAISTILVLYLVLSRVG